MEPDRASLSIDEVANLLKVGVPTVQSLINRGLLTTREEAGQPCVLYADVMAFLREDQRRMLDEGAQPSDLGLVSGGQE
jgi:excisionase family DNA binding protein